MSVDSKLFVTCGKEKLFDVLNAVTDALNTWQRNLLDKHIAMTEYVNRFLIAHVIIQRLMRVIRLSLVLVAGECTMKL